MARRIYDIDLITLIFYRRVFGKNGDSPFSLQFVGVHDAGSREFIVPEHSALFKKAIDQCGLSMINMGNDSNISD
jgi:hypothetical protein